MSFMNFMVNKKVKFPGFAWKRKEALEIGA